MGQPMKTETVLARSQTCPTCGAGVGEPCRQTTDYGMIRRAKYVHKTRLPGYRPRHCESCQCFLVERRDA